MSKTANCEKAPHLKSFKSQNITLRYWDWGNNEAPPLLLIHGVRDHARSWDQVADQLSHHWHVLALDLRGHGESDWSPDGAYMLPYHVLDLAEFIATLGEERLSIIAHSYGGVVAARYAGMYPSRIAKLVLVDSLGAAPHTLAEWEQIGSVNRTRDWIEQRRAYDLEPPRLLASIDEAVTRMIKVNTRLTQAQAEHLASHGLHSTPSGYQWKFDPRVSSFTPEDLSQNDIQYWREITAQTLILFGNQSWKGDPSKDGRADHFNTSQVVGIEGAGHWIHHDQLDLFCAEVLKFL